MFVSGLVQSEERACRDRGIRVSLSDKLTIELKVCVSSKFDSILWSFISFPAHRKTKSSHVLKLRVWRCLGTWKKKTRFGSIFLMERERFQWIKDSNYSKNALSVGQMQSLWMSILLSLFTLTTRIFFSGSLQILYLEKWAEPGGFYRQISVRRSNEI